MEEKYWLHRISHEWEVSYPLLDKGYLSLGWSRFSNTTILDDARCDDNYQSFENTYDQKENTKYRSRWNMWYFAKFNVGDTVVVPLFDGLFSIYKVVERAKPIGEIKGEIPGLTDKTNKSIIWNDSGTLLQRENDSKLIDLGFVIKVDPISLNVPRADYANNRLTSRMKMRQTNGDITDLKADINQAETAFNETKPLNFYESALVNGAGELLKTITEILDDRQFQVLVKRILKKQEQVTYT